MTRPASVVFLVVAAALAAGCVSAARIDAPRVEPLVAAEPAVEIRDRGGPWSADSRWKGRVAEVDAAARPAVDRLSSETGLWFERGREPVVDFEETAPADGDVVLRFKDGLRRPVLRISPRALLSGEFRAEHDLAPLVVRGAVLARAGERDPPGWVVSGIAIVAGGAFDRRLHRAALGGTAVKSSEAELFGPVATDPLAAAARAKALSRTSRSARPIARFLASLLDGRSEDAALADIGITRREFLDAAAGTERDRAARTISSDPVLPALVAARDALARGETGSADAALARAAESFDDPSADPWLVADARLCLARVALLRGETKAAQAALSAAVANGRVVRVREARVLGACLVPEAERASALRTLLADFPDAASDPFVRERAAEIARPR